MLGIAEQIGVMSGWQKKPEMPGVRRHVNKGVRTKQVSDYMFKVKKEQTTVEIAAALRVLHDKAKTEQSAHGITHDKVSHALRRCAAAGEVKKLREQRHNGTAVAVWITTRTE